MALPTFRNCQYMQPEIWDHLKQAIASSSGFHRWQQERLPRNAELQDFDLDRQVSRYLRETLETLAY